ncbi:MAG: 2,3-epoxybenzoyl-CoA dihydrolase [Proteobacteria bacterium]|nr:2,3-epoxybenzoyl-CoA dihydrolase [Pseudomonadota bacterium]
MSTLKEPVMSAVRSPVIDFQTRPQDYRHWKLSFHGNVATLALDVNESAGLVAGYELKLNSYDLGVDIELYDALQRLRFEHPEVGAVIVTSAKQRVFCAGANIKMLGQSSHAHKVNFCKFTNETRNAIEDASAFSGQTYLCAINGPCAGGGYELALACDYIMLIDDGATTVSLPELPLLGVLPGTGGLTRLVDKRYVRRDHADAFATIEEGIRGERALQWNLVDELVPASKFASTQLERAEQAASRSDRPRSEPGVLLASLEKIVTDDALRYRYVDVKIDRKLRVATITIKGPEKPIDTDLASIKQSAGSFWALLMARELDDVILHLRASENEIGTWLFKTQGEVSQIADIDHALVTFTDDWFVREIRLYLKRVLKRLDVTSRSLIAAIEPGSCFVGTLLEIALACDQVFMLDGEYEGESSPPARIVLTEMNFGPYPMVNGITRITSRFLNNPEKISALHTQTGNSLDAQAAEHAGLVTFTPDDIDWDDEIRLTIESRASFSPDALTGMEANLRFGGPETMESKIFSRLSAWQNWIFQRPNAVGDNGALVLYGTGSRPDYNKQRV